jgi:hypothetical protein
MGAVTKQPTQIGLVVAGIAFVLWLVLFFSGRGILVWFTQPNDRVGMLKCHYFTGTDLVERQFLYSKQGFLGRDTCPRVIELKK